MKFVCVPLMLAAALTGCADMRGTIRVEQASTGSPYDFVVHVKNSAEIGYNPEISGDRAGMAVAVVRRYCPTPRVVGQEKVTTEIYGITSSKPDYVVFVRCGLGLRKTDQEGMPK